MSQTEFLGWVADAVIRKAHATEHGSFPKVRIVARKLNAVQIVVYRDDTQTPDEFSITVRRNT